MKIGFISDTHGLLRDEVKGNLQGCDYIFHGGDIGDKIILDQLQHMGRVYAVRGNNDRGAWAKTLPLDLSVTIDGMTFYLVHDQKNIKTNMDDIDVIIFGHSHKYEHRIIEGIVYLNPGSCGKKRFSLPLTLATGETHEKKLDIKKIDIQWK